MTATKKIRGIVPPIVTPLTPNEKVDTGSLRRLVNYMIDNGVHGIWASGTTGEFAALSDDQRIISIETVLDEVAGRVPVIGNVASAGSQLTVDLAKPLLNSGLYGIAATPPYYYLTSQDEILDHFRFIRNQIDLPLWVYNIPITVKTTVDPATVAQLAEEGTVVGIKDSSMQGELLAQLNVLCEQRQIELLKFIGTIWRVTSTSDVGVDGSIPGIANVIPAILVKGWEAAEAGDKDGVREANAKLIVMSRLSRLSKTGGLHAGQYSGLKSALTLLGIIDHDTVTRPLKSLTEEEKQQVPGILKDLGLME